MEVVGRGIDINQHLITELAKVEMMAPLDYTQTFLKLSELGVLPEKFAKQISQSTGFRNAIVHGYSEWNSIYQFTNCYNDLDSWTVYRSVNDALKEYTQYCGYILKFLSKHPSKK